jgi:hypothetical protein
VKPIANTMQVRVDPRIAGNLWFLAADSSSTDTIELARIEGMEGPVVDEAAEFDRLGMSYRCHHHVGAAAIDFRGLYRNPGA